MYKKLKNVLENVTGKLILTYRTLTIMEHTYFGTASHRSCVPYMAVSLVWNTDYTALLQNPKKA